MSQKLLTKPDAQKRTTELRREAKSFAATTRKAFLDLVRQANECLNRGVHIALGLSQDEWKGKVFEGFSSSKIDRSLCVVRKLNYLPEEKVNALSEGNAIALTRLPEKIRKDHDWTEKALTLQNDEFEREVAATLDKKGIRREEFVSLDRLPKELADLWDEALCRVADVLKIDLKENPKRRIVVYEHIARLLNTSAPEMLEEVFLRDGERM